MGKILFSKDKTRLKTYFLMTFIDLILHESYIALTMYSYLWLLEVLGLSLKKTLLIIHFEIWLFYCNLSNVIKFMSIKWHFFCMDVLISHDKVATWVLYVTYLYRFLLFSLWWPFVCDSRKTANWFKLFSSTYSTDHRFSISILWWKCANCISYFLPYWYQIMGNQWLPNKPIPKIKFPKIFLFFIF